MARERTGASGRNDALAGFFKMSSQRQPGRTALMRRKPSPTAISLGDRLTTHLKEQPVRSGRAGPVRGVGYLFRHGMLEV